MLLCYKVTYRSTCTKGEGDWPYQKSQERGDGKIAEG